MAVRNICYQLNINRRYLTTATPVLKQLNFVDSTSLLSKFFARLISNPFGCFVESLVHYRLRNNKDLDSMGDKQFKPETVFE